MATDYPGTVDSFSAVAGTNILTTPSHSGMHTDENDAIVALQNTLGTTAGTAILDAFTATDEPVRMGAAGTLSQILYGTINNSVFGTPAITGGTATDITFEGTVGGTTTFAYFPVAAGTPTADSELTNKQYVDENITSQDLDVDSDSGTIAIDLDSEILTLAGGTGIDTAAATNTVTFNIDSTVATLEGTQTLTNKTINNATIGTPAITGGTINAITLGTPVIGDFTSATHTHADNSDGGTVSHTVLSDIGTTSHGSIDDHLGRLANTSGTNTGDQVIPDNEAGTTNNFLTAYNNTTGAWTKAQPTWANIDKTTSDIANITTKSHTSLTDIGTVTHADIDVHIASTANPHSVIATQVGAPALVNPSVDSNFVAFDGTVGLLKDSGKSNSDYAAASHVLATGTAVHGLGNISTQSSDAVAFTGGTISGILLGTSQITGGSVSNAVIGTPAITSGTINTVVVGTPTITGGAHNSGSFGTPTFVLGSDAAGDTYYATSGGALARLAVGGTGQVLTVSAGTLPEWANSAGGTGVVGVGTVAALGPNLEGGTITTTGTISLGGTIQPTMIGTTVFQGGTVANALVGTSTITGGTLNINTINADGANDITLTPGASKVVKQTILTRAITTNTYSTGYSITTGWGYILGTAASYQLGTVTFPANYASAPIVMANYCGYKDSTNPTAISDFAASQGEVQASVGNIGTSSFKVVLQVAAGSLGTATRFGYTWIALGALA